jgi:hypothetical protein
MIKVIKEGINEILEVNDYPEINVRVGIDVDENAIVQYNIKTNCTKDIKEKKEKENKLFIKKIVII